jgi:hypothetical protein
MMSPATGLHSDNARGELRRQNDQRLAPHLASHDNGAPRVEPDYAADILAQIDAKD